MTKVRFRYTPGENFGKRYTIIEEIGRGCMGDVYKAGDNELGTAVALKVIPAKYSKDKRLFDRNFVFCSPIEGRIFASLTPPPS